ncbi:MAG: amidohydrolase family protein [Synergistaceae bacterium]|jgi:predicted TIM-barrel fold metal-dependent hydrolase|nr:amidohydrolase family protein [Synergistaceae bacterium]
MNINKIIDTHTHVYPPDIISDWLMIAARESVFAAEVSGKAHKWAAGEDILAAMEEDGVDESWICGFGFTDLALCRLCNDYVLECAASSGGRLKALAVVPPLSRGAADEIARCAELGAVGVGEILPDGQNFCIERIDETWRFAAACHESGLFVLLHTADPVGRDYPGKGRAGPIEAYAFALNHPELHIVLAHCGGGLFLYELMEDVKIALKNVWYDTAAAPFLYSPSVFNSILTSNARDKFLYGSDFPILRFQRYRGMIEGSAFIDKDLDRLLSGNATRLLNSLGALSQ